MTMRPERSPGTGRLPHSRLVLFFGLLLGCARQPPSPPLVTPATSATPGLQSLEGIWEGDGDSGKVTLTIAGNSLYFYSRPDFQYDATFTLVSDTDPPELHATILDSPRTTDSEGELVVAIYTFENGTLHMAAIDKVDGVPASFDRAISRYRFERVRKVE